MAIIVLLLVVVLLVAFWMTMMQTRSATAEVEPEESLSPESRTMLRKLKNLRAEVEKAAERNKGEASAFVIAEALTEARHLLGQSTEALRVRDRLRKERAGAFAAEKGIRDLEARIQAAGHEERAPLEGALTARRQELEHYAQIDAAINRIDTMLQQAEAALAEMRARIATHAVGAIGEQGADDLRDAIGRMKALTKSVDEIEEIA